MKTRRGASPFANRIRSSSRSDVAPSRTQNRWDWGCAEVSDMSRGGNGRPTTFPHHRRDIRQLWDSGHNSELQIPQIPPLPPHLQCTLYRYTSFHCGDFRHPVALSSAFCPESRRSCGQGNFRSSADSEITFRASLKSPIGNDPGYSTSVSALMLCIRLRNGGGTLPANLRPLRS